MGLVSKTAMPSRRLTVAGIGIRPQWTSALNGTLGLLIGTLVVAGCATAGPRGSPALPSTNPTLAPVSPAAPSTVAQAEVASVAVFHQPTAGAPWMELANPNEDGAPRVFLVKSHRDNWIEVLLPVRPNGTRGWIRASDVSLSQDDYRIRIELDAHLITVQRGSQTIDREPIGVGQGNTPTPGGEYYITELLAQPNPDGPYGPYAYGLSGYSNVLRTFAGGDGVIGLHGTNDPGGLGRDVSHGCIRMSNEGITRLARELPLGTPVVIVGR